MTTIPNTLALCFVLGWQGGTVHQVAETLGVSTGEILNADYEKMGDLLRLAQQKSRVQVSTLLEALAEIAKGEGPFKRDPLDHADSVINEAVTVACSAYKAATGNYPAKIWSEHQLAKGE